MMLRSIFITLGVLLLAVALLLAWLLLPVLPQPEFDSRKGVLLSAHQTDGWVVPGGLVKQITLVSTSGLHVELALRIPDDPLPNSPLVVMLGGQETGRQAVDLLPDTYGVTVAALSYPFGVIPHRDGLQLAMALPTIQRGILDTPPSVMLAIDYLLQQSDLAHQGIELVGISFGAFLAAVPAAQDSRVTRLWLIHGSGDPQGVIAAGLEGRLAPAPLRELTAWLLATFAAAHHLSPELWVDRISPRPVMVVNARQDSALTEEAVAQLHNTLREPYEILWSPGDHVHPKRPETIEYITRLLFSRIGQQGQGSQ